MGLIGQNSNASLSNFRADFPLQQIRGKTFTNEIVQLDGNAFIDCTFDNVRFKFNGQAPFGFTDVHFHNLTKLQVVSDNPVVETTLKLVGALMSLEKGAQNPPNDNK
jgi:hypothetical protein